MILDPHRGAEMTDVAERHESIAVGVPPRQKDAAEIVQRRTEVRE